MIAILKFEIVRDKLPEILRREIIQYESLVVSTLKGEFSADPSPISFRVGWHQGMKIPCLNFRNEVLHREVTNIVTTIVPQTQVFCAISILINNSC